MNWRFAKRGDIAAVLGVAILLAAMLLVSIVFPNFTRSVMTDFGFGASWSCAYPGRGGPICIKKVAPAGSQN